MSAVTVIFAGARPEDELSWVKVSDGAVSGTLLTGTLEDIAQDSSDPVSLVLPGHFVTAVETPLPARSETQALSAAPFAVEDRIASDLEEVHVALLPSLGGSADTRRIALVVDRDLLEDWISAVEALGLKLRRVLPDYVGVETLEDGIAMVRWEDRVLLRDGGWGCTLDHDLAKELLPAIGAARPGARPFIEVETDLPGRLAVSPVTLLQGAFARRDGTYSSGLPKNLFSTAILLAVAGCLAIIANLVEGSMLSQQAERVRMEAERVFMDAYPDVDRVTNLRAQLRARLRSAGEGSPEFLMLSASVAAAIDGIEALQLDSIRYDSDQGELTASIVFSTYDDLDAFRTRLENSGLIFEEGGSRQAGDRRSGTFTLRLAP